MGQRRIKENKGGDEPAAKQSKPKRQNDNRRQNNKNGNNKKQGLSLNNAGTSRGQAIRTGRRIGQLADQKLDGMSLADSQENQRKRPNLLKITKDDELKIIFLGGQDAIGEKNTIVIEYGDDAIITDCGNELGLDLPGINYAVADTSYLDTISKKIRGYVFSHGHLDHVGGLPHVFPRHPAPIYGSSFTIGMVKKALNNHGDTVEMVDDAEFIEMNMDNHERLMLGKNFTVELVRITHSIPESSCIVIDTPAGRVINTGDFRLDPEPLDKRPSDTERLKQLGDEGVLVLLSESTNAQRPGRTPTEHTLQDSFHDVIKNAEGRIFVASFSSNINRIQMIINSAGEAGRKVAIDGRSMIQHVELAVKLGLLKVPKDTIVPVASLPSLQDEQILMMCTGGQGEIGAAMQRMSIGEHRHINLREGDTVVVSSTPIPGNNIAYDKLGDDLVSMGCKVFRAPTWEVDGLVGPLHVSGHGYRDEHREMIELTRPKYLVPTYAGSMNRKYHEDNAVENAGFSRDRIFQAANGDMLSFDDKGVAKLHKDAVSHGAVLVDDAGTKVPGVVVKDRLLLTEAGLVVVVLTVDRRTGSLLTSPDIITRGFIYIRDNEELMNLFRTELRRAATQRFKRVDIDRFKVELKDHVTHFLFDQTQRSPVVIPVVNVVNGRGGSSNGKGKSDKKDSKKTQPKEPEMSAEEKAAAQQKRFEELRASIRSQS
ncbi:MAG: ribonuclease J [Patescibacteria group bacterium]